MFTRCDVEGWGAAVVEVIGILAPVWCVRCGAPDRALCRSCDRALAAFPKCVRLIAGVRLDAAFEYDGIARDIVLAVKLRGRVDLAGTVGHRFGVLVRAALAAAPPGTRLIRVPCSRAGRRRRGFDPVVLFLSRGGVRGAGTLRRQACHGRRGDIARNGTEHTTQKQRSGMERVAATVGTLSAPSLAGQHVVLVDDIVTSGVTMAEAVRAVRAAGGVVVRCVAVASVPARVR